MNPQKHPIIFCGTGPGDPELITVKGQKALQQAELVLYTGSLLPEAVLTWVPHGAERISSARMTLEQIVGTMAAAPRWESSPVPCVKRNGGKYEFEHR